MNIGLDFHEVIDKFPEIFATLSNYWLQENHEIHIVTGQERSVIEPKVHALNIKFTHFFSIVDWHKGQGTPMYTRSDKKGWWMSRDTWLQSKARYASRAGLDIHFDDQLDYAKYFPNCCTFIHVKECFDYLVEDGMFMGG